MFSSSLQSVRSGSGHSHHIRRPAAGQWSFVSAAARHLRPAPVRPAGLAAHLPGRHQTQHKRPAYAMMLKLTHTNNDATLFKCRNFIYIASVSKELSIKSSKILKNCKINSDRSTTSNERL